MIISNAVKIRVREGSRTVTPVRTGNAVRALGRLEAVVETRLREVRVKILLRMLRPVVHRKVRQSRSFRALLRENWSTPVLEVPEVDQVLEVLAPVIQASRFRINAVILRS